MYPDGLDGIQTHISKNLEYPEEAMTNHISGIVIVSYVVGKEGYIDEIKIKQSVNPLLDSEAIRVIKCMKRWIPGVCEGEFARVQYNQPFKFSIK
jgi:TonB family protein